MDRSAVSDAVVPEETTMIDPVDRITEDDLIAEIDPSELERHVDALAGLERISGSEDERLAAEYVVETLTEYGVDVTCETFEAYVSVPSEAVATVTSPTHEVFDRCLTVAFGASTPLEGVHGELVTVDPDDLLAPVEPAVDIADKHVLVDSLPNPSLAQAATDAGAAGVVCLSPNEHLYEGSVSPVWGTPTPETFERLPNVPVIELPASAGERLRDYREHGTVHLTLRTAVTTELRDLPCPVGRIEGTESDRFFLVGNHIDSWHEGVTDNATAVAATLELARVFADREPKRGLVFGFWPGHSTGRYAGSAWYADEHWLTLRNDGVAYLHLDLLGLRGADEVWYQHMAELNDEHLDVIRKIASFDLQETADSFLGNVGRPARNSDQSFWGTGLSSLLSGARFEPGTEDGGPVGGGWWWHTPEDTRDKVDLDVLHEETRLVVALATRICESPVLPHDFSAAADDIEAVLDEITAVDDGTTFEPEHDDLDRLRGLLEEVHEVVETRAESDTSVAVAFEDLQVRLGNLLVPALYMTAEEYSHDPKAPHRRLDALRPPVDAAERTTRDRRFDEVTRQRARNKLRHRLARSITAVEAFVEQHAEG